MAPSVPTAPFPGETGPLLNFMAMLKRESPKRPVLEITDFYWA